MIQKISRLFFIVILVVSALSPLVFLSQSVNVQKQQALLGSIGRVPMKPLTLSQEDISNLTKPAVVRIYSHTMGTATIPYFEIDWKTFEIVFPPDTGKKPIELPLDEYRTGSGFIVHSDGYIVTNSHVVSDYAFRRATAQQLVAYAFEYMLTSPTEREEFNTTFESRGLNIIDAKQIGEELALSFGAELAEKITFTEPSTIVVLDPSSTGEKLSELIEKGQHAEIVSENPHFFEDERDIAVLKIPVSNLPTLEIHDTVSMDTGAQIYVYGYPSSGEFNAQDILEPTFTEGSISGSKDTKEQKFKMLQTNAKVSPGSSGGPLLNQEGKVAGIVTAATAADERGDAFAFAIPASIAKETLTDKDVSSDGGKYAQVFKNGLWNLQNNRCTEAIKDFEAVKQLNKSFAVDSYVQPYIDTCASIIASGTSIDSKMDEFAVWIKNIDDFVWFLGITGLLVAIVLIYALFRLMRRMKREETTLDKLEDSAVHMVASKPHTPVNVVENIDPAILEYIRSARGYGMNDATIGDELKKAGWDEAQVNKAILHR